MFRSISLNFRANFVKIFIALLLLFAVLAQFLTIHTHAGQEKVVSGSFWNYLPLIGNGDKTLTICLGNEPDTLYPYAYSFIPNTPASNILSALYDGPVDLVSFEYQPVILEKIPSLANGGAIFQMVQVHAGDPIADIDKNPVLLEAGVEYFPSGCNHPNCAVIYDGFSDVTMDQLQVTFELLPGLVWSDGTPISSSDSVYSFNLVAAPDTPRNKWQVDHTESYEALDDHRVLWKGLPGFIDDHYFLNFWTPYPEHVWGAYSPLELLTEPVSTEKPIGWGPYVINEWVHGSHITLSKNPLYFRASEELPYFDKLRYEFIGGDPNVAIDALLSGNCDILDRDTGLFAEGGQVLTLQSDGLLKGYFQTDQRVEYAYFGVVPASYDDGYDPQVDRLDFFGDVRTRRAIAMCLDRQGVIDTVYFGQTLLASTYIHPTHVLFNPATDIYPFDIGAGSALLDEVGWIDMDSNGIREWHGDPTLIPTGTPFSFNYWTTNNISRQQATQILTDSLYECGIEVNLTYWDPGPFFAGGAGTPIFGRNFDMVQFTWGVSGDDIPCELWLSTAIPNESNNFEAPNAAGYSNPDYDELCSSTQNMLPDQPSYPDFHLAVQAIFAEDLPVVPLYLWVNVMATRPDIIGFIPDPDSYTTSEMWNIENFARTP